MIPFFQIHSAPPPQFRALMGMGDAAAILAQETADETGYYDTPAYLEYQASLLQNECAVSPNAPDCLVAQATGDITMGYNPAADTLLDLQNYCQQDVENTIEFGTLGDQLDTTSCNGAVPLTGPAAAAVVIPTSFVPLTVAQIASEGAPAVTTPVVVPAPAVTVTPAATAAAAAAAAAGSTSTGTGGDSTTTAGSGSTSTSALPTWLTEDSISGIPNWILIAGALAALMILPGMLKGGR